MSDKVATGVSRAVTEKSAGWVEFEIDVGTQWPVRVATKQDEIIELGRAAHRGGQAMDWLYTEKESDKINEKSGKPFVNRYLNGVEVAGSNPDANGSPTAASQVHASSNDEGMTPEKWDAKERRDYRSRAWAQTLGAFTHTIKTDEKPEDAFKRLQTFQRLVYEDVTGAFAYPEDGSDLPFT